LPLDTLLQRHGLDRCIGEEVALSFARLERRLGELLRDADAQAPGFAYVEYSVKRMLAGHGAAPIRDDHGSTATTEPLGEGCDREGAWRSSSDEGLPSLALPDAKGIGAD
jgi:hypothetical protein